MYVGQVLFVGDEDIFNIAKITDNMILQQDVDNFGDF
jgi:predicted nuclease of predicted toxin-antitoxin system